MKKPKEDKIYFYQKNRRDYIPVADKKLNDLAKKKLEKIKKENKTIPNKFLSNWDNIALFNSKGDVEKANALYIISEGATYELSNKLNDLTSKEWLSETVTVFTQKGLGAGSKDAEIERLHPAPFSFQDVARLIKFYTKEGDTVLDPFSGVGSTLKACVFENRKGIGFELNKKYDELAKERIKVETPDDLKYKNDQIFYCGDSRKLLKKLKPNSINLVITSPPYWNILETVDHKVKQNRVSNNLDIKYSEDELDFGNIDGYEDFLNQLGSFFDNCAQYVKSKGHLIVIVSDFRKKEKYFVMHADIARTIESKGNFSLRGIRILHQKFKSIYPYGYPFSFVPNVHHQNVLIFQKNS